MNPTYTVKATGYKDKTGKDIYVFDIVKFKWCADHKHDCDNCGTEMYDVVVLIDGEYYFMDLDIGMMAPIEMHIDHCEVVDKASDNIIQYVSSLTQ